MEEAHQEVYYYFYFLKRYLLTLDNELHSAHQDWGIEMQLLHIFAELNLRRISEAIDGHQLLIKVTY
jgi:hypothetical protein